MGTPGVVICMPMPTTCFARDAVTVRKRAVSWLSSRVHELTTASQETPARNARIAATASGPVYAGAGVSEKTSFSSVPPCSHHHVGRRKPE